MRLYLEVMRLSFRRYTAYGAANLAGLVTNAFFGIVRTYVFVALFASRPSAGGYDLPDAITYVWLSQALIMPVLMWGWDEIALTVRTGDVASDLSKPFDYFAYWLSRDLGRACYHVLYRSVPTLVLGAVLFGIRLPDSPTTWLSFGLSLLLAVALGFCVRFIINVSAFWVVDVRGLNGIVLLGVNFLSGMLVPLAFFPPEVRGLVETLPFAGMVNTPVSIWLGHARGSGAIALLLQEVVWAVVLIALCELVVGLATRKLVVQGG